MSHGVLPSCDVQGSDLPPSSPLRVTPGLSGGTGPALRACGPVPKLLISTREFHSYYSPCQLPLRLPALAGHYRLHGAARPHQDPSTALEQKLHSSQQPV